MFFIERYLQIKDKFDKDYTFPKSDKFNNHEFNKCRWDDSSAKNICAILWSLTTGPKTVSEIVNNDGYSPENKRKKSRHDIYYRLLTGNQKSVPSLIEKEVVIEYDKITSSKPTQRFGLTLFGVFYCVALFSKSAYLKTLDNIAISYPNLLPLVFGKWDYLKKKIGSERRVLLGLANIKNSSLDSPLTNTRALYLVGHSTNNPYVDEVTLWFYGKISNIFSSRALASIIRGDKEIFEWYYQVLKNLTIVNKEEYYHIHYVKSTVEEKFARAKSMLRRHNAIQGLDDGFI